MRHWKERIKLCLEIALIIKKKLVPFLLFASKYLSW